MRLLTLEQHDLDPLEEYLRELPGYGGMSPPQSPFLVLEADGQAARVVRAALAELDREAV